MTPTTLFDTLQHIKLGGSTCLYTIEQCHSLAPLINEINQIKREKNAIVLAHSYVSPEIIYGVADFVGDSYELSKKAKSMTSDTIIFAAVRFMAETAKLLNPDKTVVIPGDMNGCSLADSITGVDVVRLRQQYPDYSFVCYINTTADVKAECDVCVTSSNVYQIIESIPNDKIYFLPDQLMGQNVINELQKKGVSKDIKLWEGTCYVHEAYDPEMVDYIKLQYQDVKVVSHPECEESIIEKSDFVGSTSQMIDYVKRSSAPAYFMLTECGLTSRLQLEDPSKTFVGTCSMCKYMKDNTLLNIKNALISPKPELIVTIDDDVSHRAVQCINEMFRYMGDVAKHPI
jgi:quinolinate synthase